MKAEWISLKDKKPDNDCLVYVMNERGGMCGFMAIYHKKYDIFKLYDPKLYDHPCLDVTHWHLLPAPFIVS